MLVERYFGTIQFQTNKYKSGFSHRHRNANIDTSAEEIFKLLFMHHLIFGCLKGNQLSMTICILKLNLSLRSKCQVKLM